MQLLQLDMGKPLTFSVGIPTFNQADFLEETVLSLLNQTRPPDEIIISDHFSTDHTPDIIAKYASQVRSLKPPLGVNLAGQYNFTLASQTCDWITLLSSDDLARPNFCEVLNRGAARRDDAVLVRAGWEIINTEGKPLSQNYLLSVPKAEDPPATLVSQRYGPKVCFASFAVKREAYLRSGPIFESVESLADWALWLQLAPFGSFIYENELISGYRVGHDGNKFRKRIAMWVRDEQRMFYEVMPLAAERAKMTDRSWIDEASRKNFLRYLSDASEEFSAEERAEITPLFQSWADRVGGDTLLKTFAEGRSVSNPVSLAARCKKLIRPFALKLNARLRRQ
jgi:glycosyltransferase involved in cell wall biosynthesis